MTLPLPAVFAIASAVLGGGVALLVLRISSEPGWEDQRPFALVALTAGLDTAANLPATLPLSAGASMLFFRVQLLVLGLHVAAWHWYVSGLGGRRPGRLGRATALSSAALGALGALPGLAYSGMGPAREMRWLGVHYHDPIPTGAGQVLLALLVLSAGVLVARLEAARRRGVRGAGLALAGLFVAFLLAIHDALVAAGLLAMPFLLDFGFLAPIAAVAYGLLSRFADDARALRDLRQSLEHQVEERSRELERAREALHQAEKLAALGRLSAGVAHELNSPLAVVSASVAWLREKLGGPLPPAEARQCLDDAATALSRMAHVARQLLDAGRLAARSAELPARPVSLLAVAREAAVAARAREPRGPPVSVEVPEGLLAMGEEQLLVQVCTNLVVNAVQAIEPGRPDGRVRVRAEQLNGGVRLLVEDNGPGMSEETRRRLFEPFFTTKPPGAGSGLGLAVSRGLVGSLGGDLRFESEPGRGTRAVLFLQDGSPAGSRPPQAPGSSTGA